MRSRGDSAKILIYQKSRGSDCDDDKDQYYYTFTEVKSSAQKRSDKDVVNKHPHIHRKVTLLSEII
jgi:hypothetical protein